MKKIKVMLPILLGMFLVISSGFIVGNQQVKARDDANCNYDRENYDCYYAINAKNCICISVPPVIPPDVCCKIAD